MHENDHFKYINDQKFAVSSANDQKQPTSTSYLPEMTSLKLLIAITDQQK